jgi:hypothetical protein
MPFLTRSCSQVARPRTWPLVATWSGHEKNEHIICCAVAFCLPASAHCHQFSLVLQGSFCLELLCSVFSWYWQTAVVHCGHVEEQVTDGSQPHSPSWFFPHLNYTTKIVLSIKGGSQPHSPSWFFPHLNYTTKIVLSIKGGSQPHSPSWFFPHLNYSTKIVLSIKGYAVCYTMRCKLCKVACKLKVVPFGVSQHQ